MSLLGIDVGTTGCKVVLFNQEGHQISIAYEEYDIQRPQPGWAELDAVEVWDKVKRCIRTAALGSRDDPIRALAVCSMGEAIVPVSAERQILGPSLLNFDARGAEYLPALGSALSAEHLYQINGNTLGNHFSLTKLLWIKHHQPELYARTAFFLHWGSAITYMLGAEPVLDYSLANRSLLFDLAQGDWSDELLTAARIERAKLPRTVPSGTAIGRVSPAIASELGLPPNVVIVTGAHDQCANAVGAGVISSGQAMYGMGTYICIVPVFDTRRPADAMMARGLNTEHHAAPGRYVSFIYNQGGALLKWYRDTFAPLERQQARQSGRDIYRDLLSEMPSGPSSVVALPHFTSTGPPDFISDSSGVLAGLRLETSRGSILKGLLEGATYYLRECVEGLPQAGIEIEGYRAVGGGSKSDAWIQLSADILQRPFVRPQVTEAGALGAAILAGTGCGVFANVGEGVASMVRIERAYEPNQSLGARYSERYAHYRQIYPALRGLLHSLSEDNGSD